MFSYSNSKAFGNGAAGFEAAMRGYSMGSAYFNCWGATAYVHGWIDGLVWLSEADMEAALKAHTGVRKSALRVGDVAVWRWEDPEIKGLLKHTAVYVGCIEGIEYFWHKRGSGSVEFQTLKAIEKTYGTVFEFRRVK